MIDRLWALTVHGRAVLLCIEGAAGSWSYGYAPPRECAPGAPVDAAARVLWEGGRWFGRDFALAAGLRAINGQLPAHDVVCEVVEARGDNRRSLLDALALTTKRANDTALALDDERTRHRWTVESCESLSAALRDERQALAELRADLATANRYIGGLARGDA